MPSLIVSRRGLPGITSRAGRTKQAWADDAGRLSNEYSIIATRRIPPRRAQRSNLMMLCKVIQTIFAVKAVADFLTPDFY
jgi:hypothetical protein